MDHLIDIIDSLDKTELQVVDMYVYGKFTKEEIAGKLDMSLEEVDTLIRNIFDKIKKDIN